MNKRIVVWGTKAKGQAIAKIAADEGYKIIAYCSSRKSSQQKQIGKFYVISPEEALSLWHKKEVDAILLGIADPKHLKEVQDMIARDFSKDIPIISFEEIESVYLEKEREHLEYRWKTPFIEQSAIWIENFMSEVDFWVSSVANLKGSYHDIYKKGTDTRDFLENDPGGGELAESLCSQSIVMDIGCGLIPDHGTRLPNGEQIQLIRIDPLAFFYNRINDMCIEGPYSKCQFGLFEFMANFYEENYSDAIVIKNALDHCIDPYKSVIECLYILKVNGWIWMRHRRSEGSFESYQGLHKWNLDYNRQGELIFWNQQNAVNMTKSLQEIADVKVLPANENAPRLEQVFLLFNYQKTWI